jgi:hypothetical protein
MVDDVSSNKSKLVFLVTTVVVIGLLMLLVFMSMRSEFQTQDIVTEADSQEVTPLVPDEEEPIGLVGQAIAGFITGQEAADTGIPTPITNTPTITGKAVINPASATDYSTIVTVKPDGTPDQVNGNQFNVEVIVKPQTMVGAQYPSADQQTSNDYRITIIYEATKFSFQGAKNIVPGIAWGGQIIEAPAADPQNPGYNKFVFKAVTNNVPDFIKLNQQTNLAEFDFLPLKTDGQGLIKIVNVDLITNMGGPDQGIDVVNVEAGKDVATISLKMKLYKDMDLDNYGSDVGFVSFGVLDLVPFTVGQDKYSYQSGDCDDNKADDPVGCPAVPSACFYPQPDLNSLDPNINLPLCAVCINPEAPEICDGINNDCNAGTSETAPVCADLGYECGAFYLCRGTQFKDCNNDPPGEILFAGHAACVNKYPLLKPLCDIEQGECVESLGEACDVCPGCDDVQDKLDGCMESFPCDSDECVALYGADAFCNANDQCQKAATCEQDPGNIDQILVDEGGVDPLPVAKKICYQGNDVMLAECINPNTVAYHKIDCEFGCLDGECINGNMVIPDCPALLPPVLTWTIPDELTPACGIMKDGLLGGLEGKCDSFENCKTCEKDCDVCDPIELDADGDGVPNSHEYSGLDDCITKVDCDNDGIPDAQDFCPNTDTTNPNIKAINGRINVMGCYASDTGNEKAGEVRPDGCFTVKDAGMYGDYYTNLLNTNCVNLFGEQVTLG